MEKNRETIGAMKVDELRKLAPQLGIKNCRKYKKAELVQMIYDAIPDTTPESTRNVDCDANKVKYIEEAPVGTLVAFKVDGGKAKSAKLINISKARRVIKVETVYGREYVVPYSDILWVKTNNRWPRGVYNMLKGIV